MRLTRLWCLVAVPLLLASAAQCQSPTITSIKVWEAGCSYVVGVRTTPCV